MAFFMLTFLIKINFNCSICVHFSCFLLNCQSMTLSRYSKFRPIFLRYWMARTFIIHNSFPLSWNCTTQTNSMFYTLLLLHKTCCNILYRSVEFFSNSTQHFMLILYSINSSIHFWQTKQLIKHLLHPLNKLNSNYCLNHVVTWSNMHHLIGCCPKTSNQLCQTSYSPFLAYVRSLKTRYFPQH
jgi:hypothetical protein